MGVFKKTYQLLNQGLDSLLEKAKASKEAKLIPTKSYYPNDTVTFDEGLEYKEKYGYGITFDLLRSMAAKDPIVSSIIQTRKSQIKNYSQPAPDKFSPGFKFVLRNREEKPSDKDKKAIKEIETWILNTGITEGRPEKTIMDFGTCLSLWIRDLLIYDQVATETIMDNGGDLCYFMPAASGSIRYATENIDNNSVIDGATIFFEDKTKIGEIKKRQEQHPEQKYKYVQLYQGQIVQGFYSDELNLSMMNPITDLDSKGYSVGPLELAVNVVTYHLFAETHNKMFFVHGMGGKGILHLESEDDIPNHQQEAFRKSLSEQIKGSDNAWRLPIVFGKDKVNWISLTDTNNRDMEWQAWNNYLIKLICALYSIDPSEINFDITRESGSALGNSGSRDKTHFSESKSRGLKPILQFIEHLINENILKRHNLDFYNRYEFKFVGYDAESKEEELNRIKDEGSTYKTINEIRAEQDLEPIEGGQIIRDTQYIQWYMAFSEEAKKKEKESQEYQQKMFDQKQKQSVGFGDDNGDNRSEYDGIELGDIDLGNLSQEEAKKSLQEKFSSPKLMKVKIYRN